VLVLRLILSRTDIRRLYDRHMSLDIEPADIESDDWLFRSSRVRL